MQGSTVRIPPRSPLVLVHSAFLRSLRQDLPFSTEGVHLLHSPIWNLSTMGSISHYLFSGIFQLLHTYFNTPALKYKSVSCVCVIYMYVCMNIYLFVCICMYVHGYAWKYVHMCVEIRVWVCDFGCLSRSFSIFIFEVGSLAPIWPVSTRDQPSFSFPPWSHGLSAVPLRLWECATVDAFYVGVEGRDLGASCFAVQPALYRRSRSPDPPELLLFIQQLGNSL